jgi:succinylglutamate desuccinylase
MDNINQVLIVGGTHGNELIGVYAIKKFQRSHPLIQRPSFVTHTLLANPGAIAANVRYLDQDLNRAFVDSAAPSPANAPSYEQQRAAELRAQWGQPESPVDLLIDLHGTTANARVMLILDDLNPFTLHLAAYLSRCQPHLRVYSSSGSGRRQDSLRSQARYGIGIEVGPVAHGTLRADLFQQTEATVLAALDFVEQLNQTGTVPADLPRSVTCYCYRQALDYPRDEQGQLQAMIHPDCQFRDYEALHPGDPLFLSFDGDTIPYQGETVTYPVFVNEAAYYEKHIALYLTEQQIIPLP